MADDTKVGERTARQYVAHLERLAAWLEQHYQAALWKRPRVTCASTRRSSARVGSLPRSTPPWPPSGFFSWVAETERVLRNLARHLTDVAAQPLAPKGFSDVERRRLVRQAEKDGPMAEAIVMLLLNTVLRVDELVTLTWQRVNLLALSGWIDVVGKDKRRRLPLNLEARRALQAMQPVALTRSLRTGRTW